MALRFECGECGRTLSVKDELAGKRVKCPCGAVVVAGASAGPSAASAHAAASKSAAARPTHPHSAGRPSAPGRPTKPASPARPANPYAFGGSDLSSLFDELTESDLKPRATRDREAAEAQGPVVDPLAAYGDVKPAKTQRGGAGGSRPVGLIVLAVINFLLAALAITLGMLLLFGAGMLGDALDEIELLQNIATIMSVLILVAGGFFAAVGIGLLSSKPWGWWLAATVYAHNVFDRIFTVIFAFIEGEPPAAAFKGAGAILVAIGLLSYLFSEDIRSFFGVKTKPAVAAGIAMGAAALLAFLVHLGLHFLVDAAPAE